MESNSSSPLPATPTSSGKVRVAVMGGILLLGVLFITGFLPRMRQKSRLEAASKDEEKGVMTVLTVQPSRVEDADLLLPGSISAIEETIVNARTSGYLRRRYVDIGTEVKAGTLLAEIESPEVDQQVVQANADIAKSRATVGQSEADVVRQQAGVLQTQSDVARQKSNVKQAEAQLASTEAKLSQAQAAEATAQAKLQQTRQALEIQKANLAQASAQQDLARSTSSRYDQLLKEGFIAPQDADEKRATVRTTAATVQAIQAQINASQADIDAAQQALRASQAAVRSAEADVRASRENVRAAESVLASTQATVLAARANVRASRANVQANRAAVGSSVANAQRYTVLRGFERIVAPFDGVITSRNVDTGALVGSGGSQDTTGSTTPRSGLFGIARTDTLRIQINVPQSYVNAVHNGQPVTILIREFPGKPFQGTIFQSSGALDSASRTLLTEVRLANKDGLLRPGMYAQVQMKVAGDHKSLRIPANTLVLGAEGVRVAVVTPDSKLHFVPIQTGRDFGNDIEVMTGLNGNEQLVSNPTDDLKEGATVKAEAAPTAPPR